SFTESGSAWSSRSVSKSSRSMRDVASASASVARRAFSALRMPAPTASSALTAVMPTIAIDTTASSSEIPRRGRLEGVDTSQSVPRVDFHDERDIPAAHHDAIGERRAARLKHISQAEQARVEPLGHPQVEHALGKHAAADRRRGVDLELERFWIDANRDGRVMVERHLARVAEQADELIRAARGLLGAETRERRRGEGGGN